MTTTESKKLLTYISQGDMLLIPAEAYRSAAKETGFSLLAHGRELDNYILSHDARIAHEQREVIRQLVGDRSSTLEHLNSAMPWNTTFLFLEPGCEAVGQATPLAKAIESAMKAAFQRWEQSWIRPSVEPLAIAEPFLED